MKLQHKNCGKVMTLKQWKSRKLHAGSIECPKCHTKLHIQELKKV